MGQDDELTVEEFVARAKSVAGDRFEAAYRFGSDVARGRGKGQPRMLVLVNRIDRPLLDEIRPVVSEAQQQGIRVRLDTADNLVRGADAFPAFSLELIRHRKLIDGKDVLAELSVETKDLRLHVEHGLRGIFRDLVSGYIDGKIHGASLLEVRRATRRLIFLLEGALLADGRDIGKTPTPEEIIGAVRSMLSDDPDPPWQTFQRFLDGDLALSTAGMQDLYGALFSILNRVIDHVDRMPASP